MQFETLIKWLTNAALLEEPDSTTTFVINKIFAVLQSDLSTNPKGSINIIRDHLHSLIDHKVVFPGLQKPIDIFEALDPAKKSGKEWMKTFEKGLTPGQVQFLENARDLIKDENQKKQNEKEVRAAAELIMQVQKKIPSEEMERHIQNIRDALERENVDEAIYHLFTLNTLLRKIRLLLGKDQAKLDATDFMNIIKQAYPELSLIACNDTVKQQGTLLQEMLQMAHQELDRKMLSPTEHEAMSNKFNIAKTALKIFASAVTEDTARPDELFNPDAWGDAEWEKTENKAKEFDIDTALIRHLSRNIPIEDVLPKANQLLNANKPMLNQFQTKLHDHQLKHAREIFDAQMKLANQSEQGKKVKSNVSQRGSKVSFEFLRHIQKTIYTTDWKPARFFGTKVYDTKGKYINTVRKDMIKMLDIIEDAYRKDQTGTSPVWIEAFNKVAKLGKLAASKQPMSLFGMGRRSWEEQQFYEKFVTAYSNRELYLAGLDKSEAPKPKSGRLKKS